MNVQDQTLDGPSDADPARSVKRLCWILVMFGLALVAAGCGEDEPEITMAERLADVEGRELSEDELNDRLAVGNTLCRMDDAVLDAIWRQLNERQLNYQDVVYGHICPDRSVFYASLTGRYVTAEALESGVVPSTTRPPLTTAAPSSTTTIATTTTTASAPTSSGSSGEPEEDPAPDGDDTDGSSSTATTAAANTSSTDSAASSSVVVTTTEPASTTQTTVDGEGG